MRIVYTSTQRPAPALRLRHSVGRFRFTFPALTLCMYLTCADINSTHRARSRVPPVRRGAAPSIAISPPSTRAPARRPSSPVPGSSLLFISNVLYLCETSTRTRTVPGCPSTARTGATPPAAPAVSRIAPPCHVRAVLALCRCACYVCPRTFHSAVSRGVPASPCTARP